MAHQIIRVVRGSFFLVVILSITSVPAAADVHTIQVNEFYTQCDDGSVAVQYIELKVYQFSQFFRQCASIQIKRTVAGPDVFFAKPVFVGHSDGEAFNKNKTFLIATASFQSIVGVVPDLLIPDGILDPAGGVIRFAADSGCALNFGTIHLVAYGDQGTVPAPGPNQSANLTAFLGSFTLGSPTPRNFANNQSLSWTCLPVPVEETTWGHIKSLYDQ